MNDMTPTRTSSHADADQAIRTALDLLVRKCPRLIRACYWAGTAAVATEELHHRCSMDLDLHTHRALLDVRPLLADPAAVIQARNLLLAWLKPRANARGSRR